MTAFQYSQLIARVEKPQDCISWRDGDLEWNTLHLWAIEPRWGELLVTSLRGWRFTFPHWRALSSPSAHQQTAGWLAGWLHARVAEAKIITLHISMAAAAGERAPGELDTLLFQRSQTFAPAATAAMEEARARKQTRFKRTAAASGRTPRPWPQPRTRLGRIRVWIWTACIGFVDNESNARARICV